MRRRAVSIAYVIGMSFLTAGKARAVSESDVIFIQEVNPELIWHMIFAMIQHVWKDVLSVLIAAVATVFIVILTIRHKPHKL